MYGILMLVVAVWAGVGIASAGAQIPPTRRPPGDTTTVPTTRPTNTTLRPTSVLPPTTEARATTTTLPPTSSTLGAGSPTTSLATSTTAGTAIPTTTSLRPFPTVLPPTTVGVMPDPVQPEDTTVGVVPDPVQPQELLPPTTIVVPITVPSTVVLPFETPFSDPPRGMEPASTSGAFQLEPIDIGGGAEPTVATFAPATSATPSFTPNLTTTTPGPTQSTAAATTRPASPITTQGRTGDEVAAPPPEGSTRAGVAAFWPVALGLGCVLLLAGPFAARRLWRGPKP